MACWKFGWLFRSWNLIGWTRYFAIWHRTRPMCDDLDEMHCQYYIQYVGNLWFYVLKVLVADHHAHIPWWSLGLGWIFLSRANETECLWPWKIQGFGSARSGSTCGCGTSIIDIRPQIGIWIRQIILRPSFFLIVHQVEECFLSIYILGGNEVSCFSVGRQHSENYSVWHFVATPMGAKRVPQNY